MNYVYAPNEVFEIASGASVVEGLIERDYGFQAKIDNDVVTNLDTGAKAPIQAFYTYLQQLAQSNYIDKYSVLQSTSQDGVQPDGRWLTTEHFIDRTYQETKQLARNDLAQYIQDYRQSYFTAGGFTFPANVDRLTIYNTINTFATRQVRLNQEQPTPLSTPDVLLEGVWIFDVEDQEFEIPTVGVWDTFVNKWDNLWRDATSIALTAWRDIRNATTTQEVRQIMNALPPIPTSGL